MLKRSKIAIIFSSLLATLYAQSLLADNRDATFVKEQLREQLSTIQESGEWWQAIAFSGLIEVEAFYSDTTNWADKANSDLLISTLEFGVEAALTDTITSTMIFLYEQDTFPLDVEVAIITWNPVDAGGFSAKLGKDYAPFGAFQTTLINTTLIEDLAETLQTVAQVNWEYEGLVASVYAYNGRGDWLDRNKINEYGARLGYQHPLFNVGVDYSSTILTSENIRLLVDLDNTQRYGAFIANGQITFDQVVVIAEYLHADKIKTGTFAGVSQALDPKSLQLEVAFVTDTYTLSAAYQTTDDAWFMDLPEKRYSAGISVPVYDNVSLGLEYWLDDKDSNTAGTESKSHNVAAQVAINF